jgi:DNA invertase Pin-like site-specific DNA recombinase
VETKAIRCVIYARQSKTRDGSESIETQIEVCRTAAERFGFEIVAVLAEPPSTSGYKNRGKSREKFKTLLRGFVSGEWELVMAYKTDRLSRGGGPGWAPLLEAIERAQLDLDRSVATPSGFVSEFEIGIRATTDREESKKISERMSDIAERKAKQGKPQGGRRPFGYQKDMVTINEEEAAVLREIAGRVIAGKSYKSIAWWLNAEGVTTSGGKLWYPLTVRNTIIKPRYAGYREHDGQLYPATWKPIFDAETWEQLKTAVLLKTATNPNVPKARRYMLTGLAFCGGCGMPLNGMTKRDNPSRPLRRTYQCRVQGDAQKKHGCGGVTRNADALDHWVRESIFAHLKSTSLLELLGANEADAQIIRELITSRDLQRQRMNQLVDDYATGVLERPQFERAQSTAKAELTRIERLLTRHMSSNSVLNMLPSNSTPEEAWKGEDDEWRRALASGLIEKVIVRPGITKPFYDVDGKMARFDPSLVEIEWRDFTAG